MTGNLQTLDGSQSGGKLRRALLLTSCIATSAALLAATDVRAAAPADYMPCSTSTTPPVSTGNDIFQTLLGADGKGGEGSSFEGPGHAGAPGDPGLDFTFNSLPGLTSISFFSLGGNGGEGSDAGSGDPAGSNGGGVGVAGGSGGTLNLTVSAPVAQSTENSLGGAVCLYSAGGVGGAAGFGQKDSQWHAGGTGGAGGALVFTNNSSVTTSQGIGLTASAIGGNGAIGKNNDGFLQDGYGGNAGNGGSGQLVTVTNNGSISSFNTGIFVVNNGGDGGTGGSVGEDSGEDEHGGTGGNGGAGGTILLFHNGAISVQNSGASGILAQSFGGLGGAGGSNGTAGKSGSGGQAGAITISLGAGSTITIAGQDAPGILAQSFGGQGAAGSSGFAGSAGGTGGDGSGIIVQGSGTITVGTAAGAPSNSQGILAQSIGGGGGNGGDTDFVGGYTPQVGGRGALSASGGSINININTNIITFGDRSRALMAQSIGGGGGNGGAASGSGAYYVNAIGGSGGGGGDGAAVTAGSAGVLTTSGFNASGILLQSIGGGGGNGGSANSKVSSEIFGMAFSTGGSGAAGGQGGAIQMFTDEYGADVSTNGGVIWTSGLSSIGVIGQSIGGGGGTGGTTQVNEGEFPSEDYPTVEIGISHGGNGGAGGNGAAVDMASSGLILTSGGMSRGMVAQSIGGGGGEGGGGGNNSGMPQPSTGDLFLSFDFLHGGKGGTQGTGGAISLNNSGLLVTTGVDADGLFAQSIGGGGGLSGIIDANGPTNLTIAAISGATPGLDPNALGGTGDGGAVSVVSSYSMLTLGDGAVGMMAQSVGGGGGKISGLAGQLGADSGTVDVSISLGTQSGGGSNTGGANPIAEARNVGILFTFGADAAGMIAQSVGGGGGMVGKGATSIGFATSTGDGGNAGTNAGSVMQQLASTGVDVLPDVGSVEEMITLSANMLGASAPSTDYITQLAQIADAQGSATYSGKAKSLTVALALGAGSNTTGQDGGYVLAQNQSYLTTGGKMSTGMLAQSIGAGGGIAGAANTVLDSASSSSSIQLGALNGAGGDGGRVVASNSDAVVTIGSLAPGILAQSIGGGGGLASLSGSSSVILEPLQITLGTNSQKAVGGSGGSVEVDNTGWIVTLSHDSVGILAQSIGGGGGLVRLLATDLELDGGQVTAGQSFAYDLAFGACLSGGWVVYCGDGGDVTVTNTGSGGGIETNGDGSHGILAQSIGGGGGAVLGGQASNGGAFGSASGGDAGEISITVGNSSGSGNSNIVTSGDGAAAILAQSIGGGGGLAGRLNGMTAFNEFAEVAKNSEGNGNAITILLNAGTTLSTSGSGAPVILAQSIGGGGGLTSNGNVVQAGSLLGDGPEGPTGIGEQINVTINGTVLASGANSAGIMLQSMGGAPSNGVLTVTIGTTGVVRVGQNSIPTAAGGLSAGIFLDQGSTNLDGAPNVVTNNGSVLTYGAVRNSVAVYSRGGYTHVINNGTMAGDVLLTDNNGAGCFTNTGTFGSGDAVTVGTCGVTNSGMIIVGRTAAASTLTITGNYTGTGKLLFDADFAGGSSDKLVVTGDAVVGDTITVNAKSISNRALKMVSVSGSLTLDPAMATADSSHLYDFKVAAVGNELSVAPVANFTSKAAGFGANEKAVAANLQSLFDGGASADVAFTRLLGVVDDAGYAAGLQSLAGQGLGAFGAFRFNSSRTFAANLYGGCQDLQLGSRVADRCGWARLLVNDTTQDAGTDKLGYTADAWASQKSIQLPLSEDVALIGSIAYESTKFRDESRTARISGDSLVGGVGLLFTPARFELSAGIDAAYGWYKSSRQITLGLTEEATAKPEQSQIGGHLRAAWNVMENGTTFVRPFMEGHAIHVSNKAFTETGASPFRLAVEAQSDTAFIGVAGVELGTKLPLSTKLTLRPFAGAAIEYGSPRDWTTRARFADQPQGDSFDLTTAGPGTLGRFTIGADILGSKNIAFSVQYAPEVGRGFNSHSGTAKLTIAF